MGIIISGSKIAKDIRNSIKEDIEKNKLSVGLAVILVGNDYASEIYVKNKHKFAQECGMKSVQVKLSESITEQELIDEIKKLNEDKTINGIIVQLPLPKHINEKIVIDTISTKKDVDGFSLVNSGKLFTKQYDYSTDMIACTPKGCIKLIKSVKDNLRGMDAAIIGRSNIVGKPVSMLLLDEGCSVSIYHSGTKNLKDKLKDKDIVISATGIAGIVKGDMIKEGAILIDVGINRDENGKTVGDIDFSSCQEKSSFITPVPGGVGPMTIACLLENTLIASKN